jgi:hypothetical protein
VHPGPDIADRVWHIGFVPIPEVDAHSLDHLVGAHQQRRRHLDAKRLGGLQVHQKLGSLQLSTFATQSVKSGPDRHGI